MDGWYVKQLLLDRNSIKSNIVIVDALLTNQDSENNHESYIVTDINLDDSTYDDLLTVELTYNRLYNSGLLTSREYTIVNLIMEGYSIQKISKNLKMFRNTVIQDFNNVCEKIAFNLGGYFTNEGFISMVASKHSLSANDIKKIKEIINK